jgi:hypothetical protein
MSLRRLTRRLRTSAALGLPAVLAPAMVFVPLGVLLGPWGTNVLDARVVGHLEPVVSILLEPLLVALAAGLVVENAAAVAGDALRDAVEHGALPILVVFFTAAARPCSSTPWERSG